MTRSPLRLFASNLALVFGVVPIQAGAVGAAFLVLTVELTQGHDVVRGWIAGVPWL